MSLARSLGAVALVWSLLWLLRRTPLLSFVVAAGITLRLAEPPGGARARIGPAFAGAAVGVGVYAPLCGFVWRIGSGLGLPELPTARTAPLGGTDLIATLLLAPLFEELLYRGLVLDSVLRLGGAGCALVVSSLLFSLPHGVGLDATLGTWRILGIFCAGIVLGLLQLAHRRLWASVGTHAGFNLTALLDA